jgi:hypothetical protein
MQPELNVVHYCYSRTDTWVWLRQESLSFTNDLHDTVCCLDSVLHRVCVLKQCVHCSTAVIAVAELTMRMCAALRIQLLLVLPLAMHCSKVLSCVVIWLCSV